MEPVDYHDPHLADRVRQLAPAASTRCSTTSAARPPAPRGRCSRPGGALVSYAIITAVSGTGSLWPPFLKAVGQALVWSALPIGRRARFYDLWSGHRSRPARFRRHLEEDLGHVFALLADGTLTSNIAARYPLEDTADAFTLAESCTLHGKVLLFP